MEAERREALRLKTKSGNSVPVRNVMITADELLDLLEDSAALGRVKQLRDDELEFADDFTISIGELIEALGRD